METLTARDVLNPRVLTIRDDRTVEELATFLSENQISGAPVVDPEGKLVGMVSVSDIAEGIASGDSGGGFGAPSPSSISSDDGRVLEARELRNLRVTEGGRLVRDLMTPAVFSVPEETPVTEIAKTMVAGRIHRLLVTDKGGGKLLGIIAALDLVGLLAYPEKFRAHAHHG